MYVHEFEYESSHSDVHKESFRSGTYWVPEAKLPLAHPGESCGEDVSVSGEDRSHWPDALVWSQTLLLVSSGTTIITNVHKKLKIKKNDILQHIIFPFSHFHFFSYCFQPRL